jgi:ubiquinol-cytochrome c reductase cytochrome b subunit
MDVAFSAVLLIILACLAHFAPVPLGPRAAPTSPGYVPRPEWYFLPLFQWLKYWPGSRAVIGIVVVPALVLALLAFAPFWDRNPSRLIWRRWPSVGIFLGVLASIIALGLLSRRDDRLDAGIAAQLARQRREEIEFMREPFQPSVQAAMDSSFIPGAPISPGAAAGRHVFESSQCVFCHGEGGVGTKAAPRLAGVVIKMSEGDLAQLIRHPNPKMKAGGMPAFTGSDADLHSLIVYLQDLG